ncbi:MAG TPA: phosphate uptake regulator PhoU [Candidatus Bathyarchaeota archaeon]|nr:phosphate uptake regulator PhoU [Candidatus Bathyarchaeota archaeon]
MEEALKLRKVQEVGRGTLVVSLPKSWAKRYGVKKGTLLAISEARGGQLIISPFSRAEEGPSELLVSCDGRSPEQVRWAVIGAYLLGYDLIELRSGRRMSSEMKAAVREAVRSLAGLEIVGEDMRRVLISCLIDPSAVVPKTLLARKNAITMSMHTDATTALVTGDKGLASMVVDRDEEVDRLYFLTVRLLRTAIRDLRLAEKFGLSPVDCLDYRMAAKLVESIGDHAVDMAKLVFKLPEEAKLELIGEQLQEASSRLKEIQEAAMRAFLAKKPDLIDKVKGNLYASFSDAVRAVEEKASDLGGLSHVVLSATYLMEEVAKCCVDIADLVIPAGVELG